MDRVGGYPVSYSCGLLLGFGPNGRLICGQHPIISHQEAPGNHDRFDFMAAAGYDGAVCFELSRSSHAAPEMLRRCREALDAAAG